ncbi:hypothetical protein [uncultured Dysosmobacter sp.]|uniref:hypothetical protein n=1 Tax=uncultured Dysosmobacter sp. TaxID=2591384 RepID=UPI00261702BE|nr:hypothetical protein [uncultured Dysosmobacter sp.]
MMNTTETMSKTTAEKIAAILADLPRLDQRVTVYVPATVGTDNPADSAAEVDAVAAALSTWFGGATIQPGAGCWMSDACGLVKEATTTVYAACTEEQLTAHLGNVRKLCENLKAEMQQEAVSLAVNNTLYFV